MQPDLAKKHDEAHGDLSPDSKKLNIIFTLNIGFFLQIHSIFFVSRSRENRAGTWPVAGGGQRSEGWTPVTAGISGLPASRTFRRDAGKHGERNYADAG